MTEKEKLEALAKSLPVGLPSRDVILKAIQVIIALKELYDLLSDREKEKAKLFAATPELHWQVIDDATELTDPDEGMGTD